MSARADLLKTEDIYGAFDSAAEALFLAAALENAAYHARRNPLYAKLAAGKDFACIQDLPALPTVLFKRWNLNTREGVYASRSFGTSGLQSEVHWTAGDVLNESRMALAVLKRRGLLSSKPAHFIVLGEKPSGKAPQAVRTAALATRIAPAASRYFAMEGGQLDMEELLAVLEKQAKSPIPCILAGFPFLACRLLLEMKSRRLQLQLPAGSKIILGGGWKGFEGQAVSKEDLYGLSAECLGIGEDRIVEVFSAVEHPVLYLSCEKHHFHVPAFSRVIVRDVQTFRPLGYGRPGLLNFVTPLLQGSPLLSVVTDDIGILRPAEDCGCGLGTPFFEVLGRAGAREIRTCAEGMQERAIEVAEGRGADRGTAWEADGRSAERKPAGNADMEWRRNPGGALR